MIQEFSVKKLVLTLCTLGILGTVAVGCAYGGAAMSGDKAVVLRNDMLLAGMLRKAYVCQVTDGGLSQCSSLDNP